MDTRRGLDGVLNSTHPSYPLITPQPLSAQAPSTALANPKSLMELQLSPLTQRPTNVNIPSSPPGKNVHGEQQGVFVFAGGQTGPPSSTPKPHT